MQNSMPAKIARQLYTGPTLYTSSVVDKSR